VALVLTSALAGCGTGDNGSPTAPATPTPTPSSIVTGLNTISVPTITPAVETVLRRGEPLTLTAVVDYSLGTADGGIIALVTQSTDGPMLERTRLRIARGSGRLTIAGTITVPLLTTMRVFVLLLPDGATGTSTITVLDYRIE
jgi:hypothetical protein